MTPSFPTRRSSHLLTVHAIHRLLTGRPDDLDLLAARSPWFEEVGAAPEATPMTAAMADAGCLAVVLPDREVLIRPRPDALTEARDLDSRDRKSTRLNSSH